jgi:hypothetical protein
MTVLPSSRSIDTLNTSTLALEALERLRPLFFSIEQLQTNPDPQVTPTILGLCQLGASLIDDYRGELEQIRDALDQDGPPYRSILTPSA